MKCESDYDVFSAIIPPTKYNPRCPGAKKVLEPDGARAAGRPLPPPHRGLRRCAPAWGAERDAVKHLSLSDIPPYNPPHKKIIAGSQREGRVTIETCDGARIPSSAPLLGSSDGERRLMFCLGAVPNSRVKSP